jgi:hypothetical protein
MSHEQRNGREIANSLPTTWCPDRPPAERVARLLLNERAPELRYDLVDAETARAWLAQRWPGHVLPDVMSDRDRLLDDETVRVRVVLGYVLQVTGLAQLTLEPLP